MGPPGVSVRTPGFYSLPRRASIESISRPRLVHIHRALSPPVLQPSLDSEWKGPIVYWTTLQLLLYSLRRKSVSFYIFINSRFNPYGGARIFTNCHPV